METFGNNESHRLNIDKISIDKIILITGVIAILKNNQLQIMIRIRIKFSDRKARAALNINNNFNEFKQGFS